MSVLLWAVIGYAAGSFPAVWIVAAIAGRKDVLDSADRTTSAGDAHHLLKAAGARAVAAAATADVLKAFVPTLIAVLTTGPHEAAACGIGAVAGHCWPPFLRRLAGRGLAAGAGAYLPILPVEMVAGGLVTLAGTLLRIGGPASTLGFLAVPALAVLRGQPPPTVLAGWAIFVLIVLRRLEGVGTDVRRGVSPIRSVAGRALLDVEPADPREER